MAVEAIKALGQKFVSKISSKKAEAAAEVAIKDGEKALATAQDAAAVQGRAMVKPYVKPQMETANIRKESMQAASGGGGTPVMTESDSGIPSMSRGRGYDAWGDVWGE
ncbi:MAG: hypothetical protein K6E29_01610 [Cyanobacteria bacterium RUI128]|nr:hypothetical protein [Cyanobacteria bacterium RUI128]